MLSNIVITTETTSLANKDTSAEPNVVEKICTTDYSNEEPQLSSNACSKMPRTIITEIESTVDVNPPKSAVIIIQSWVRGYLVRRALLNSKNVVKLQAVVHGHLVRRHVVGASRRVQAITKMQDPSSAPNHNSTMGLGLNVVRMKGVKFKEDDWGFTEQSSASIQTEFSTHSSMVDSQ